MMVGVGMDEIVTVVIVAVVVVQSLFGVGVLFLGTPILMILGLPFIEILRILHPISLSINSIQSATGWKQIQWRTVKWFVILALPSAALGTVLLKSMLTFEFLPVLIGIYLFSVSLGFYFKVFPGFIEKMLNHRRSFLLVMGLIHGFTNLGGPLLSSYVMTRYPDKHQSRSTTAICYGMLVTVQIITLAISGINLWFTKVSVFQILLALLVFALVNAFVYERISNQKFRMIFGFLLLIMSALLLIKYFQ